MKLSITKKITFAGALLAIAIVMQFLKNISPFISGPVINAILVVTTIEIGLWWGVGFSIIIPIISMLLAPAMTTLATATYGVSVIVIILGNIIFILSAYFARKLKIQYFVILLIVGAVLKWLFMWGAGNIILLRIAGPTFATAVQKIFATLQLFSALISTVIIVPLKLVFAKIFNEK